MQTDNRISEWLLNKPDFSNTTVEDWEKVVNENPAFSLAQLFLAKKLKETNEKDFAKQLPKTALRFNDIFWLNFLLNNNEEKELKTFVEENISSDENDKEEAAKNETGEMAESRLASILQAQAEAFKKPVDENASLKIETELLYKTDYFASQGIVFAKPQDAFGNKVKKFTDWLKEIKNSGTNTPQLNTTEAEEKQIENKAAASLNAEEIITEPMAEVLVQQSKNAQAIEVYKKLSLIYPEKSTYFAAKINSLQ